MSIKGACVVIWLSGWGTTRGAASNRRRLDVEERGEAENPLARTSCRRVSCGTAAAAAAAATATGSSVGSPSKKRAIAIYKDVNLRIEPWDNGKIVPAHSTGTAAARARHP